jgi:hypothetical protein
MVPPLQYLLYILYYQNRVEELVMRKCDASVSISLMELGHNSLLSKREAFFFSLVKTFAFKGVEESIGFFIRECITNRIENSPELEMNDFILSFISWFFITLFDVGFLDFPPGSLYTFYLFSMLLPRVLVFALPSSMSVPVQPISSKEDLPRKLIELISKCCFSTSEFDEKSLEHSLKQSYDSDCILYSSKVELPSSFIVMLLHHLLCLKRYSLYIATLMKRMQVSEKNKTRNFELEKPLLKKR